MIIDTHIHLDDERYREDFDAMLQRAGDSGVEAYIIPGAHPGTLERAVELAEAYENIYFAVGVHPYDCENFEESIFEFASHPKCVAIGECGLDYYRLPDDENAKMQNKKLQKEVFVAQIQIAKKLNKPLIVHIRDAYLIDRLVLVNADFLLDQGAHLIAVEKAVNKFLLH